MKTFDLYGKCDGCKQQKYANAGFIVQTRAHKSSTIKTSNSYTNIHTYIHSYIYGLNYFFRFVFFCISFTDFVLWYAFIVIYSKYSIHTFIDPHTY